MFKKPTIFFTLLLMGFMAFSQQLPPKSTTLVTDFTNTLSEGDKQQLESKLLAYNDSTTTQIAIVIIKSVGEYDIGDYGQKLGRAWGIGTKEKDNGILILVALDDHKMTIQTGKGTEGAVPDITTHEIIQNDLRPHFKQNDYAGGFNAAIDDLVKSLRGEYKAPAQARHRSGDGGGGGGIGIIVIIVIVIIAAIFRGGGGGGHIIGGRGGASPFWWFLGGAMLGRGSSGWGGGEGGGGGGDSGGSFGGFGGGDFGGGGSSGSW